MFQTGVTGMNEDRPTFKEFIAYLDRILPHGSGTFAIGEHSDGTHTVEIQYTFSLEEVFGEHTITFGRGDDPLV